VILTVAQQKGGAGKTTVLVQLATAIAAAGRKVAIVDIDPQASLTGWMRVREHEARNVPELRFSMVGGWRLAVELDRLRRETDAILVDTPPHTESEAKVAIRAADLVLVPVQPSMVDLWASRATIALAAKEGRRTALLLNRVPPRGRAIDEALQLVEREGWPLLQGRLGNRQTYVASFARGLGAVEHEPRSPSAEEVRALVAELGVTGSAIGSVPPAGHK
jgi:chromosome partitioning protein